MKRTLALIVLLVILVQPGLAYTPAVAPQASVDAVAAAMGAADELASSASEVASMLSHENPEVRAGNMPGWPLPARPIPHHEPGRPSRAGSYSTQVQQENELGVQEVVEISGVDAMAADGIDPLAANYTLVDWDKILFGVRGIDSEFRLQTLEFISPTLSTIPGSDFSIGGFRHDIVAGDLNGDGQDEQIAAWLGADDHLYLSIGEMPGSQRATSAPAAVARSGGPSGEYALDFDGAGDYVDVGDQINLANASFTVALWTRRDTINKDEFVVGQGSGSPNEGLHIGFRNDNTFTCAFWDNDLDTPAYTSTGWHHWACTYDSGTNIRTIYRDGVQVAQDVASDHYQGEGTLYIGRTYSGYNFDGLIDDVGIWNVARTQEQIQVDPIRPAPDATGLVAYWPFDEGSDETAYDASGNGHDGTLYGPLWHMGNAPVADLHLVVRGYDESLWHCAHDVDSGDCLTWSNAAGGLLLSGPAIVPRSDGAFHVFAVGSDNQVWQQDFDGSGWDGWAAVDPDPTIWPALDAWRGPTPELPAPAVVGRSDSRLDLFRLGLDNTLRWNHSADNGASWGGWEDKGGMISTGLGAVSLNPDHMQVFARGVDEALWTLAYNSGIWGDWQRIELDGMDEGVTIASGPTAVSPGTDQIRLYVLGSDNKPYWIDYASGSWGSWIKGDGELASAPGAALWSGNSHLFALSADGSLQQSGDGVNWNTLEGLPPGPPRTQNADTGLVGYPWPADTARSQYHDFSLDIETGHFSGDGRQQIVLAYHKQAAGVTGDGLVGLALWDPWDPMPKTIAHDPLGDWTCDTDHTRVAIIATGDFDGEGRDEIAAVLACGFENLRYQVKIFSVEPTTEEPGPDYVVEQIAESLFESVEPNTLLIGLEAEAGDFDGDGKDDIVVGSSWWHPGNYEDHIQAYGVYRYVPDNDQLVREPDDWHWDEPNTHSKFYIKTVGRCWGADRCTCSPPPPWPPHCPRGPAFMYEQGLELAVGNFDADVADEFVTLLSAAGTRDYGAGDYGDAARYLLVYDYDGSEWRVNGDAEDNFQDWSFPAEPIVYGSGANLDRLVTGDLDRDLVDEVGYFNGSSSELNIYELDPDDPNTWFKPPPAAVESISGLVIPHINMVAGNLTGESLRVGPPTYREQYRVDSALARLNMPPKHWDMIKKEDGSYETIQILTEECWTSPNDPKCTHTLHGTVEGETSSTSIETKRDWATAIGMEWKFSNTVLLEGSLEKSYGSNFGRTEEEISTRIFSADTTAGYDDAIVFYGNPYKIWEYPVFSDNTTEPARYITVMFPNVTQGNAAGAKAGAVCQEGWYSPGHQPYNVWSYDPIGDIRFPDYDPLNSILSTTYQGAETEFKVYFEEITGVKTTSSQWHGISRDIGVGFEFSGAFSLQIKGVGVTKNYENRFKAYTKSDYRAEEHVTDETQASNETYFSAYTASTGAADSFRTRALAYWSAAGPLVIDFQTMPGEGSTWQKYDKADPAFILPWYGYPDPDNLPYPDPNNQGAPPCGPEKQHFSHDVVINPPFAGVGETVTISATVRNFSEVPADNIVVRFYQGDPAHDAVIGQTTITHLDREDGPATASVTWTTAGTGEQKIYAVIDPEGQLDEMHDEGHIINNNKAYGLLQVGAASYFDMGVAEEQPYDPISYDQGGTLTVTLYVPPASLNATTRLDLHDVTAGGLSIVGNPFEVVATQGSDDREWGDPIEEFNLRPDANDPPAVIGIAYAEAAIGGLDENELRLYRLVGTEWAEATCAGYQIHRFPEENLIFVPVCRTGVFVFAATPPGPIPAPEAQFSAGPTSGPAPLEVTFTDQSSNYPTSWLWDFGDGDTSTLQHPSHIYTVPGIYTVTLEVSNLGGSDTVIKPDHVTATGLLAAFSADPTQGTAPLTVTFTDQSAGVPGLTSWDWDFGDSGTSTEQHPEHTYTTTGTFTVTLTVTNGDGSDTLTVPDCITVNEKKLIYLPLVLRGAP